MVLISLWVQILLCLLLGSIGFLISVSPGMDVLCSQASTFLGDMKQSAFGLAIFHQSLGQSELEGDLHVLQWNRIKWFLRFVVACIMAAGGVTPNWREKICICSPPLFLCVKINISECFPWTFCRNRKLMAHSTAKTIKCTGFAINGWTSISLWYEFSFARSWVSMRERVWRCDGFKEPRRRIFASGSIFCVNWAWTWTFLEEDPASIPKLHRHQAIALYINITFRIVLRWGLGRIRKQSHGFTVLWVGISKVFWNHGRSRRCLCRFSNRWLMHLYCKILLHFSNMDLPPSFCECGKTEWKKAEPTNGPQTICCNISSLLFAGWGCASINITRRIQIWPHGPTSNNPFDQQKSILGVKTSRRLFREGAVWVKVLSAQI